MGNVGPVRVGVTGHRWNVELPGLRRRIGLVLTSLAQTLPSPASVVVISPLAEGADRLVADEALQLDAGLECLLPLPQADYEHDFAGTDSVAEFRRLLRRSQQVRQVASADPSARRTAAYAAVGREVVACSDVLLAIWDGHPSRGEGGTAEVVTEALEAGRPVLWVHVDPPHGVQLLGEPATERGRQVRALVEAALRDVMIPRPEADDVGETTDRAR